MPKKFATVHLLWYYRHANDQQTSGSFLKKLFHQLNRPDLDNYFYLLQTIYRNMSQRSTGTSCFRLPLKTFCNRRKQCCRQNLPNRPEVCSGISSGGFFFFQSEPKLTFKVTKPIVVVRPVAVEIHSAIQPPLDHYPSPAGSFLVTKHFKVRSSTIWVDFINITDCFAELGSAQFLRTDKNELI